jgi:ribosomal subunit interface protein
MTFRVSGKNFDIGESLRHQIEERIAEAIHKYIEGGTFTGHATVDKDGTGFRTYCVVHLSSGITLEAHGYAHDAHVSFAEAAERMEKRLRRYKRRLRDRHNGQGVDKNSLVSKSAYKIIEPITDAHAEEEEFHPVIVAETTSNLHSLSVSDAVLELDMTGSPVIVFRHASHGRVNIVYRRRDGSIGWIDPSAEAA